MILPDFILNGTKNKITDTCYIDSLEECIDKLHYKNYPHEVRYVYNSRGFRDTEWPTTLEELQDSIWCVGDSFTVGLGSPYEHTWVSQLQKKIDKRCINIGMNGASNAWIARKINRIAEVINPKIIIPQWSFSNRDESPDVTLSDEKRMIHYNKFEEFSIKTQFVRSANIINSINVTSNVIHSFVPDWITNVTLNTYIECWDSVKGTSWPPVPRSASEFLNLDKKIKAELTDFDAFERIYDSLVLNEFYEDLQIFYSNLVHVPEIIRLDFARDGYHYDVKTAKKFVDDLLNLI